MLWSDILRKRYYHWIVSSSYLLLILWCAIELNATDPELLTRPTVQLATGATHSWPKQREGCWILISWNYYIVLSSMMVLRGKKGWRKIIIKLSNSSLYIQFNKTQYMYSTLRAEWKTANTGFLPTNPSICSLCIIEIKKHLTTTTTTVSSVVESGNKLEAVKDCKLLILKPLEEEFQYETNWSISDWVSSSELERFLALKNISQLVFIWTTTSSSSLWCFVFRWTPTTTCTSFAGVNSALLLHIQSVSFVQPSGEELFLLTKIQHYNRKRLGELFSSLCLSIAPWIPLCAKKIANYNCFRERGRRSWRIVVWFGFCII